MHFKMTPAINLSIIAQNAVRLVRTSPFREDNNYLLQDGTSRYMFH